MNHSIEHVETMTVIKIKTLAGDGAETPIRPIISYWTIDGKFLAEYACLRIAGEFGETHREVERLENGVRMWLGQWRDNIDPEAVKALQDLVQPAPVEKGLTQNDP